jgi:1-hydroxycarotenoid 3,4-desaturase
MDIHSSTRQWLSQPGPSVSTTRIVVVGAGIGGLSAAMLLAARGAAVTVVERAAAPGGKMRTIEIDGQPIDAGPTVFTMRWVFEELFAAAGLTFADRLRLVPAAILARHAWNDRAQLDLHADIAASADAIGRFSGAAEARRFLEFCAAARNTYLALEHTFLTAERPSAPGLVGRMGLAGLRRFSSTNPMASLWSELGRYFHDPRLRQLFGRYATYVGSSPFAAPSTLMLIAHVEQDGVWLVEGGMHRIAVAMADAATRLGAEIRYRCDVSSIAVSGDGRATGVVLADGTRLAADAVVFNGDAAALAQGLAGAAARSAVPVLPPAGRSLSAVTFAMRAEARGFPLARHNVLFSADYRAEFDALVTARRMPADPTVYICAQDRGDEDRGDEDRGDEDRGAHVPLAARPDGRERLLCLINAPATGDRHDPTLANPWTTPEEICRCRTIMERRLAACGLTLTADPSAITVTTPSDFSRLFPGTGGALYGMASHGWTASFRRPAARTRLAGLYLAGGSAHPGAGVPMAALSGRIAAESLLKDLASQRRFRPAATPGGMSTA